MIRRATMKDAAALAEISCRTFFDTFTGTCTQEDMQGFLEANFNLPKIERELQDPQDYYFLVFVDEALAGYMRFSEDYSGFPEMTKWRSLELKRIYVLNEFKGAGIAKMLIEFLEQFARVQQYEAIYLGVWENNLRARRFYEKCGYTNSGHTHDFPIGQTPQMDYWYWKFLGD